MTTSKLNIKLGKLSYERHEDFTTIKLNGSDPISSKTIIQVKNIIGWQKDFKFSEMKISNLCSLNIQYNSSVIGWVDLSHGQLILTLKNTLFNYAKNH